MISGPEQARLITSFENEYFQSDDKELNYHHHEEGLSTQNAFKQQVTNLTEAISEYGNPFLDDCPELLVLHTRECADAKVVTTIRNFESLGLTQYQAFQKNVLIDRNKSIHDPIKKNNLPLLKSPKPKRNSEAKKLAAVRNDANLFGRLYIANQQRDGDLDVFFSHENQLYPPSLSDYGRLRTGTKSDLLRCFETDSEDVVPGNFDCKIFDGAALVHSLPTVSASTFKDYAEDVFCPFLERELHNVTDRVDVVWDQYVPHSLKASTREKRGSGVRLKVNHQTKMPSKWKNFLLESTNKEQLFTYLTQTVARLEWPVGKSVFITNGIAVVAKGTEQTMSDCTHEEADTRMVIHIVHALSHGATKILLRTVDTDVLVILIGHFFQLKQLCPAIELWVAFGVGKDFCHYSINSICAALGKRTSEALPVFHAFTGSDTTSSFFKKGKKTAWQAWKSYPVATEALLHIRNHPFQPVEFDSEQFQHLERLTIVMYDKTSTDDNINDARRELFSKRSKSLENIPPTKDALLQHAKRAIFQAGIWTTSMQEQPSVPVPEGWGWTLKNDSWDPVWMTLPEAAKACTELIKCTCKSSRGCRSCKCARLGLTCTDLCNCLCEK